MSKTETLRQLSDAANKRRVEEFSSQIKSLKQANFQSAEELAMALEPIAQAMAALVEETRQTLAEIAHKSQEQNQQFCQNLDEMKLQAHTATTAATQAADQLSKAGQRLELSHYLLVSVTGIVSVVLVSGLWLWLAPPTIQNSLNPDAVAELLKPSLEQVLMHPKGK